MSYQNITASLSPADIQEIKASLQTIHAKLPFLVTLSAEERRKMVKMGDKSLAFVNNSATAAQSNRNILPATFNVEELVQDYQLAIALTEVLISMRQLTEQVDDTSLAVGSEAYAAALQVYSYAKASGQTGGLDTVVEEMGQRFARKSRKAKPQAAAL